MLVDPVTEGHNGIANVGCDVENIHIHHAKQLCRHLNCRFQSAAGQSGEDVHDSEQPLAGALQLIGGLLTHFEFLSKITETLGQRVDLFGGGRREDLPERVPNDSDNADQVARLFRNGEQRLQDVAERLDQVLATGHSSDLIGILLQIDRTIFDRLVQLLQVVNLVAGHPDVRQFCIRQTSRLLCQIGQSIRQNISAEPSLVQAVLKLFCFGGDLFDSDAMSPGRVHNALLEANGVPDAFLQKA